jgi:hypothetical protein
MQSVESYMESRATSNDESISEPCERGKHSACNDPQCSCGCHRDVLDDDPADSE